MTVASGNRTLAYDAFGRLRKVNRTEVCPECGTHAALPPPRATSDRALVAAFALVLLAGVVSRCAAAELAVSLDERAFRAEAASATASGAPNHLRRRALPTGGFALWFVPGRGYEVVG